MFLHSVSFFVNVTECLAETLGDLIFIQYQYSYCITKFNLIEVKWIAFVLILQERF